MEAFPISKELKQLTTDQLLDLFSERGISGCEKNTKNRILLNNIGYYELKRYSYKYFKNNKYRGLSFNYLLQRYYLDKKLKSSILDAIEDIELALNSYISKVLGNATIDTDSSLGYLQFIKWCHNNSYNKYLNKKVDYAFVQNEQDKFLKSLKIKTKKSSLPDIENYLSKSKSEYPPVWMMVNVLNFGDSIHIFNLMDVKYKEQIADEFNLSITKLSSWFKCLNLIRNICCHNENLIDINLKQRPKEPKLFSKNLYKFEMLNKRNKTKFIFSNKIALIVCIICEITNQINPYYDFNDIYKRLKSFIKNDSDAINYGFKSINNFNKMFISLKKQ